MLYGVGSIRDSVHTATNSYENLCCLLIVLKRLCFVEYFRIPVFERDDSEITGNILPISTKKVFVKIAEVLYENKETDKLL